ncbi:hypothetical protein HAX54_007870, partial [Datura stramonium]|nr:hypothetical protein [Datura stramonium]
RYGHDVEVCRRKRNTGSKKQNQIVQHTGSQIEEGTGLQQGEASTSDQKIIQGRQIEGNLLEDQSKKSKNTTISVGVWVTPSSQNRQQGNNVV